jgi:hypothetical protein
MSVIITFLYLSLYAISGVAVIFFLMILIYLFIERNPLLKNLIESCQVEYSKDINFCNKLSIIAYFTVVAIFFILLVLMGIVFTFTQNKLL